LSLRQEESTLISSIVIKPAEQTVVAYWPDVRISL